MSLPQADKNFGQHFLTDQKVIDSITEDFSTKASAIIEVGPGPGVLTQKLFNHEQPFAVIEKDKRFREILEDILPAERILLQDALTVDLNEFIHDKFEQKDQGDVWLVSNLPYNVSAPLTLEFIKEPKIKYMSLMYQKEVGIKILNSAKKENNNSLHMLCSNYFEISTLCKVLPGAFTPPPKVDSIVLSYKRKEHPAIPLSEFGPFEKYLRNLFQQKRKQLGKVLKQNYDATIVEKAFEENGLSLQVRAEKLDHKNVVNLYRELI
jgi:16S rRNA (adenine1518-N6/adenine1519-N6)-dimethyltransferase